MSFNEYKELYRNKLLEKCGIGTTEKEYISEEEFKDLEQMHHIQNTRVIKNCLLIITILPLACFGLFILLSIFSLFSAHPLNP